MSNIVDSENKQIGIDAIIIDMNTMNPIGCKIVTFLLSVIPFNLYRSIPNLVNPRVSIVFSIQLNIAKIYD